MYVIGDVAAGFVNRPAGVSEDAPAENEVSSRVASVMLPDIAADQSSRGLAAAVRTSAIEERDNIVGFQGDFTFDERVVRFAEEPVEPAGLTAQNWNVSGNVLPGSGPIRTLRVSAYSEDFTPLQGNGRLFELRMIRVTNGGGSTPLLWGAPPNNFIFINADLNTQQPGSAPPGTVRSKR